MLVMVCTGGCTGWVWGLGGYRVGAIPGYYPATARRSLYSEAGPGSPGGAGVGGTGAGRATGTAAGRSCTHPAGPVGQAPPALPGAGPCRLPPPGPKRRDLTSFPVKLVKRTECHRKVSRRPPIVPISKTVPESRLLIFSDFHLR